MVAAFSFATLTESGHLSVLQLCPWEPPGTAPRRTGSVVPQKCPWRHTCVLCFLLVLEGSGLCCHCCRGLLQRSTLDAGTVWACSSALCSAGAAGLAFSSALCPQHRPHVQALPRSCRARPSPSPHAHTLTGSWFQPISVSQ